MKDDWLNKNLSDKLDGYDSPMDLENAWESLQTKRQTPKKKKRFLFFWWSFGILTFGLWGSYFILNNSSSENHNIHNNTFTESKIQLENQDQVSKKIETTTSTLSELTKSNNTYNAVANTFTEDKNKISTTKNVSVEKKNNSIVNSNLPFSQKENDDLNQTNTNFIFPKKSNTTLFSPNQNEAKNAIVIDSTIPQKEIQPIAISLLPSLEIRILEMPQENKFEILNTSFPKKYNQESYSIIPIPVRSEKYINIQAGYGIRSKGKVLSSEDALDVISVNALYERYFDHKKIYFKTGITFDQFINSIEKISEQGLIESRDDQLISVNHFQDGTIENIFGIADVKTIKKTTEKNYNRYRLVSIPVLMGYDLLSTRLTTLQIEGGFARSVFGIHSGKYFELVDSDFEKQGVWQGIYGVNFNLKMGRNAHLFTSVRGNYHFNKIGKSDLLHIEKFSHHQIQLGLKFKL